MDDSEGWPALPLAAWRETYDTLHMWTQILGKIRLKLTPHVNHWWEVPFYLTSRGLTSTAYTAKKRAELAPAVGPTTDMFIVHPQGTPFHPEHWPEFIKQYDEHMQSVQWSLNEAVQKLSQIAETIIG